MDAKDNSEAATFADDGGHARVDDPVGNPARFTSKKKEPQKKAEENGAPKTSHGLDPNCILTRLFDPDRMQKPAIWKFIKLVAPGPASSPPPGTLKWRSKDAIAAYCLKCKRQFTYTKGTSKTISRHMMAHHGYINTDGDEEGSPTKKRSSSTSKTKTNKKEPPLKKRKQMQAGKKDIEYQEEEEAPLQLLQWVVGSFRPFDIVQDAGLRQLIPFLTQSPLFGTDDLLQLAKSKMQDIKARQLQPRLRAADSYAVAYEVLETSPDTKYVSVRVTFCTETFERHSWTIQVTPLTSSSESSSIQDIIQNALEEYKLDPDQISIITQKNKSTEPVLPLGEYSCNCIMDQMENIVQSCLSSSTAIQNLLDTIATPNMHATHGQGIQDLYLTIQKSIPDLAPQPKTTAKALTSMLKPFYDAMNRLSSDPYPMMIIPVFRRITNVLEQVKDTEEDMEIFRKSLLSTFALAFQSILNSDSNSPLLWTVPLDPRLIDMKGLLEEEKEKVLLKLTETVREIKLLSLSLQSQGEGAKGKRKQRDTMDGLFFGDEADDTSPTTTTTTTDKTAASSSSNKDTTTTTTTTTSHQQEATAYARTIVDRYIDTIRSGGGRVEDPLDWWNKNGNSFPELAVLAKKWLGASPIYDSPSLSLSPRRYQHEQFEIVSFLNDNIDLINKF